MIKPLTSLRFFFAFFVCLSHLPFLKEDIRYKVMFETIFSEGFLGVSFFFILSGFILSLNYKEKIINRKITLIQFFVARFARIYPLHFITMLVSIPAFYSGGKNLLYNVLLLQSYIPNQHVFFSYNAPSWSISDEMFFYVMFPTLMIFLHKISNFLKTIFLLAFITLILLLNVLLIDLVKIHYWLYISPFVRVFDFILGILLFDLVLYLKNKKSTLKQSLFNFLEVAGIATLVIFFIFHNNIPISYRFSIYYWLPMCMIIVGVSHIFIFNESTTWISKILSWKILVYLGEISFGFYLINYLVLIYANKFNGLFGLHIKNIPYAVETFIITLIVSIFAFEYIEKPLNRTIKNMFLRIELIYKK
jgi:peptidoglycan/LPS O-acetylase OafA/YrhL